MGRADSPARFAPGAFATPAATQPADAPPGPDNGDSQLALVLQNQEQAQAAADAAIGCTAQPARLTLHVCGVAPADDVTHVLLVQFLPVRDATVAGTTCRRLLATLNAIEALAFGRALGRLLHNDAAQAQLRLRGERLLLQHAPAAERARLAAQLESLQSVARTIAPDVDAEVARRIEQGEAGLDVQAKWKEGQAVIAAPPRGPLRPVAQAAVIGLMRCVNVPASEMEAVRNALDPGGCDARGPLREAAHLVRVAARSVLYRARGNTA